MCRDSGIQRRPLLFWSRSSGGDPKADGNGSFLVRTSASHHQFAHSAKPGLVTVPHPKKDLLMGTLKSIEKQAGIRLR